MTALQIDMFAPPVVERPRSPFPAMNAEVDARDTGRRPPKDLCCATCALTWADLCDQSDFRWIDEGLVAMTECWRCWSQVCHRCRLRGDRSDILCPTCFEIPEPPSDAECEAHFYGHNGADYVRAGVAWRYEAPEGQFVAIAPAEVWYWQTCDTWKADVDDKEMDRRLTICTHHTGAKPKDAAWAPPWLLEAAA